MLLLRAGPARACLTTPERYERSPANVVAGASQIFLAVAVGSTQKTEDDSPVSYRLRVVRVLKNNLDRKALEPAEGILRAGHLLELPGFEIPGGAGDADRTFSNHTDEEFWLSQRGRLETGDDCELRDPGFTKGRRYLVFLGSVGDTKDVEEVDSDDDKWLRFVTAHTRPRAKTARR